MEDIINDFTEMYRSPTVVTVTYLSMISIQNNDASATGRQSNCLAILRHHFFRNNLL